MSTEAEIEAAAIAMWLSEGYDLNADPKSSTARELRPVYMDRAHAALAAVEPLIRERLAQEVEASRHDPPIDVTVAISGYPPEAQTVLSAMWHLGIDGSVRIVRGDAS